MRVRIPSPLFSYTAGRAELEAKGRTLGEVLDDLEAGFPGLRFRIVDEQGKIREHIRIYVGSEPAPGLDRELGPDDELMIVAALSGGT